MKKINICGIKSIKSDKACHVDDIFHFPSGCVFLIMKILDELWKNQISKNNKYIPPD